MKRLKDEADALCADLRPPVFVQLGQVGPIKVNRPLRRQVEAGEQRKQGRLASPRCANDCQRIAPVDAQADI